jgi:hypothetical protein
MKLQMEVDVLDHKTRNARTADKLPRLNPPNQISKVIRIRDLPHCLSDDLGNHQAVRSRI